MKRKVCLQEGRMQTSPYFLANDPRGDGTVSPQVPVPSGSCKLMSLMNGSELHLCYVQLFSLNPCFQTTCLHHPSDQLAWMTWAVIL